MPAWAARIASKRTMRCRALVLAIVLVAGCSQAQREPGSEPMRATAAMPAAKARDSAMLAYEHDAELLVAASEIPARLRGARAACVSARFGACTVLTVGEEGGDTPRATLGMRLAPQAVEPMIGLAGKGAQVGSRSTRAEDLADVVRDNTMSQDRLRREMERLQQFQARGDLSVADMIALSKQLAETESQLQAAQDQGARHRQRIETQLLTLRFVPPGGESGRGEIARAVRDFGGMLATGTAWTIRAFAFLVPMGVLVAALVFMRRRWRRRAAR